MPARSKFIVVANRLPAHRVGEGKSLTWRRSPGGLVSAMEPVLHEHGGVWVGWDGAAGRAARAQTVDNLTLAPVALNRSEIAGYYEGFSNVTIWPLYHDAIRPPQFHRSWWKDYLDVNKKFATAAVRHARKGATVWVHDYHLQLVPAMVRQLRPDLKIGFFLHIPFPPEELFAWLPWRSSILRGLLGADLLSFQTEGNAKNFARAARQDQQAEGTDRDLIVKGREIKVRSNPISIDADDFERLANDRATQDRAFDIKQALAGRKVILGVDRLDYTKGIPDRLRAFEELLKEKRVSIHDVVMLQVAVPSREDAAGYQEIRREVEESVGRINGQFGEPGKVAVHYFRRSLDRRELAAHYLAADVMLVTPLRDGMNLVAKEYVATNSEGVLVLSEFAGAARELRRALLVNPRDIDALKNTIIQALKMPEKERRMRMAILRTQVHRHDVFHWAEQFLETLQS